MTRKRRGLTIATIAVVASIATVALIRWLDEPEASCDTQAGPTAILGLGPDGTIRWTRLTGHTSRLVVEAGGVTVEGRETAAVLDPATGTPRSCTDLEPRDIDVPAVATSLGPNEPGEPVWVERTASSDWRVLVATEPTPSSGQTMHVAVETKAGERTWDAVLPGFVVTLADDLVLVIDQTDGTGTFDQGHRAATRLTAYDAATGTSRWHVNLPGTPYLTIGAGDLVIIPGTGGQLFGLDRETGGIAWETDIGNPGRTRHYSEPGNVTELAYDDAAGTIIAAVRARAVYRD